jgi:Tol biopolymer transport system component
VDPELWALLERDPRGRADHLIETAAEIRDRVVLSGQPEPDPDYKAHLRASLLAEGRLRVSYQSRPRRRFGLAVGAAMGIAGLAMLSVVLVSVVFLPAGARSVTVNSAVTNNPRVPVTQAIQLSFNQPMVEPSVERGLKINPAVSYSASWLGSQTLVIAPEHDLVPNVSYVVSIARTAAVARNGATPLSNIVIPFGTLATSNTSTGVPPALVTLERLDLVQGAEAISYAPDGQLLLLASGSVTPINSSSSDALGTPPTGQTYNLTTAGTGVVYTLANPESTLVGNAVDPTPSPDSQELAYWSPTGSGADTLEVVPIGGSGPVLTLSTSTEQDAQLAWLNDSEILYSSGGQLFETNLDSQTSTVYPDVKLGASGFFSVSPSGLALFSEPAGVPTVYDLGTGTSVPIPGLQGLPTWSGSSSQLAYVTQSGGRQTIDIGSAFAAAPRPLLVAPSGVGLSDLAYSPSGDYIAYSATTPDVGSQIGAVSVSTGTSALLSTLTGMTQPTWSPFGNELTALDSLPSGQSDVITLELSNAPQTTITGGQSSQALEAASNLAQLQMVGTSTSLPAIHKLLTPNTSIPTTTLLPGAFNRFYAVSSTPASAGSSSYAVDLELVRDASVSAPAAYLQEQVTVDLSGSAPTISSISQGTLTKLPAGPLVLGADSQTSSSGVTSFMLQFDADLDPATVGSQSISLTDSGQPTPDLQINYESATREVTVTADNLAPGPLVLTVSSPLSDVNHVQVSVPYQLSLPAVPTPQGVD